MNLFKTIIKILGSLAVGIIAGQLIGGLIATIFTGKSFSEFCKKLISIDFPETMTVIAVAVGAFVVSIISLVVAHETGHLIAGRAIGYRFVSFRVFNLTIIRVDGKLRLKRFAVSGTGGQCLLTPPDLPEDEISTAAYNLGGIAANVILLIAVLPIFWLSTNPFLTTSLFIFLICDVIIILMNGIPMAISGMGNDAYNARLLRRNKLSKHGMIVQLRSNALIQEGVRPRDMPAEWFRTDGPINYRNAMEVSLPIMHASRTLDFGKWEEAHSEWTAIYSHRAEMIPIYVNETACELAFTALITGRLQEARELLTPELRKYITTYSRFMSSKLRLMSAIALYLDENHEKAFEIYQTLLANKNKYLLQGEVKSDLDLMKAMLETSSPCPVNTHAATTE